MLRNLADQVRVRIVRRLEGYLIYHVVQRSIMDLNFSCFISTFQEIFLKLQETKVNQL